MLRHDFLFPAAQACGGLESIGTPQHENHKPSALKALRLRTSQRVAPRARALFLFTQARLLEQLLGALRVFGHP